MTLTDLETLNPEAAKKYESLFGTGGDHWGGSGLKPMCLSKPEVKAHYKALFADAEAEFPELAGFMFFGGDSFSLVCDDDCPACGNIPAYRRWGEWIDELRRDARSRGCSMRFDIMNWPWWDDMFDMAGCTDPEVGFIAVTNWGFKYGERSDGKYPAVVQPWEIGEYQCDCLRTDKTDHGTARALTQGWFNAPVSDSFKKLAALCKRQGRRIVGWTELICSEAVWPYFLPSPATTVERLSEMRDLDLDGVFDLWGIAADMIYDKHTDANLTAFSTFFDEPYSGKDAVLAKTANILYGSGTEQWAVKAWRALDDALAAWGIISYTQRMHWTLRRFYPDLSCSFYALNLTLDPFRDEHLHFIPMWPEFLLKAETWLSLRDNLEKVVALYDEALGYYDRVTDGLQGEKLETAVFHQDSLLLGRTYQQLGLEASVYHASAIRGEKLSKEFMRSAVTTRRLCRLLYTKLGTVPVEHRIDRLLAEMSEYCPDNLQ